MNPFADEEQEYIDQTFSNVNQQQAALPAKRFENCTFVDCTLRESSLKGMVFQDCTFKQCDLGLVDVTDASFREVRFEKTQAIGINWSQALWQDAGMFGSLPFIDCVLNYSSFFGVKLHRATLEKCAAKDVDFAEADLTGANFSGTDFAESRFLNTILTEADFTDATNYAINPMLNTLKQTKFALPEAIALLHSLDIILVD